jgi:putative ABC transport system permease protein
MAVRNIVRWPLRSGLTVVGIALAQGILVASLFVYDSVDDMIDAQFYRAQRQDVTVSFVQTRPDSVRAELANLPGVLAVEPYRAVRTRLVNGARMERRTIHGLMPGATLYRTLDNEYAPLPLAESGIQLTAKLAELLKAGLGDAITVEVLEAERPVRRLNVSAILDEPLGTQAYMARPAITELMGETARADGAYLLVDADQTDALYAALKGMPGIAGIALRSAALDSIEETLAETMDVMITFYVTFGVLIAFGIVYNSARVSLSEHGRDLASLRVLGLTRGEVFNILLGQLAILTAVALAVGCLVGWAIAWLMTQGFDSELFRIRLVITPATMALAALITLGAAAVSVLLVKRRLDALDLIAVLKTRE